jgi:uncharacterized protein YeaO (DUF488 family)
MAEGASPSPALRKWFGHDPNKWNDFRACYRVELARRGQMETLRELAHLSRRKTVTLLYGAADERHNQAVALKAFLDEL